MEKENKSNFGKDFGVGCMSIIFILFVVFIVIPVLTFIFKVSFAVAILVGIIMIAVVGVAFFGKIVLYIKEKW
ncbi:MAG: hypothetical protein HQK73_10265 [Desulfamplus sp.]|nr:hypothetical protein [Desulfamplus sp.]MBF0412698.1 hypothetical protein [Desulfamplus sp.]